MRRKGHSDDEIRKAHQPFRTAMNDVAVLWHNNLRFASEARLKAHLVSIGKVQGIKGDAVKKNAADLIAAAQ